MRVQIQVLLWSVWCASSAAAELCDRVHAAERLEAALFHQVADLHQQLDPILLHEIRLNSEGLDGFFIQDTRLAQATAAYVSSVAHNITLPANMVTDRHRGILRYMMRASVQVCGPQLEGRASPSKHSDRSAGAVAPRDPLNWKVAIPATTLSLIVAAVAARYVYFLLNRRRSRQKRYACYIDVQVETSKANFAAKILDISGKGTKLRLPDGMQLQDPTKLSFEGLSIMVRPAWQNQHFCGATFKSRLPRNIVRKIASEFRGTDRPRINDRPVPSSV